MDADSGTSFFDVPHESRKEAGEPALKTQIKVVDDGPPLVDTSKRSRLKKTLSHRSSINNDVLDPKVWQRYPPFVDPNTQQDQASELFSYTFAVVRFAAMYMPAIVTMGALVLATYYVVQVERDSRPFFEVLPPTGRSIYGMDHSNILLPTNSPSFKGSVSKLQSYQLFYFKVNATDANKTSCNRLPDAQDKNVGQYNSGAYFWGSGQVWLDVSPAILATLSAGLFSPKIGYDRLNINVSSCDELYGDGSITKTLESVIESTFEGKLDQGRDSAVWGFISSESSTTNFEDDEAFGRPKITIHEVRRRRRRRHRRRRRRRRRRVVQCLKLCAFLSRSRKRLANQCVRDMDSQKTSARKRAAVRGRGAPVGRWSAESPVAPSTMTIRH